MFSVQLPTPHFRLYATAVCVAATDDPSGKKRHAIGFCVGVSGTVIVRERGGVTASDQTIPAIAGKDYWIEFDQLVATGTATGVLVYWGR
jgi:hypothetical protein